jgi:hypothetical protein
MAPKPAIAAAALASGISVPVKAYKSAVAPLAARLITDGYCVVALEPEAVGPLLDARGALFDALAGSTTAAAGASSSAVRRLPTRDLLELIPGNEVQLGCNLAQLSTGVQVGPCSSRDARRQRAMMRLPAAAICLDGSAAAFTGSAR